MNENLRQLEEKIAYLERHVTQQDKAMLEMAEDIARLKRELRLFRERLASGAGRGGDGDEAISEERPPHY